MPKTCTSVSPLVNGAEFTLPLPKTLHSSKQFAIFRKLALFAIVLPISQMAWQRIEAPKQTIKFSAWPSFFSSKKWIKLTPKTIGNRKKRLFVRLRSGDKHHLRKSSDRKAQNQEGVRSAHRTDLCFSIWRFSQVVFIPRAHPHAQSLFSISNSFWY